MVTTRRGTETPGMASTPASSAKKIGKRELDALETPTQVKRQRKTTVEVKRTLRSTPRKDDAESSQEEGDEDEAEAEHDTAGGNASPLAIRRRSSPKVLVEPSSPGKEDALAEDGFHTPEPASSEAAFVTPFTSKKALAGSPTPKAAQKDDTPAAAKKARGRPKKTQEADANVPEEIPSSTQASSIASPAADAPAQPKAHVRFGSEEPTANLEGHTRYDAPAPPPAAAEQDDADSGSDSDEAPEMVSTGAAARQAAALAADATRAQAAQSEKERRKRSAREQRVAAEQAAKRSREALKEKRAAARAAKAARLSSVAADARSDDDDEDPTPAPTHRAALPSLLPDSLLAGLDPVRPPTPPPEARGRTEEHLRSEKLNRHIKFLEQSSKAPKDRRVGKHHVAVLAPQSKKLAAKASRNTKGVREAWLKGRQGRVAQGKPRIGKTHRAKFGGGGFLRGED